MLGDVNFRGEGGAAEGTEIDVGDAEGVGPEVGGDAFGGDEFLVVALAVIERQGVGFKAFLAGDGEAGGGLEATA